MSNKYESITTETFDVDGYTGEVQKTYVPNRIDPDGCAFGHHLKSCEVSLTDPNGKVWQSEIVSSGGGGSWSASSTEYEWRSVRKADDVLVLTGEEIIITQTYNEREAWRGGWSTSRYARPIEVMLR